MKNRPDKANRSNRVRRSAVGGAGIGGKLNVIGHLDTDYIYRTVNDDGARIQEMEDFGYEVVNDKNLIYGSSNPNQTGSTVSVVVDKKSGMKGVLMRQPKEYHEEDRELRAEAIAKSEEAMFREIKTEDGRYGDVERTNSLSRKLDD